MTPWPGEARVKRSDLDAWALSTTDAGKTMSGADVEFGPGAEGAVSHRPRDAGAAEYQQEVRS